jgi:selenocysteine lyase/cysteine desulfurase
MPLDLQKLRPDYVVSVGYKWLLGPYGCSYFYVAPHRQAGQPIEDSWSGRKGAEDSSSLTNYTEEYLSGARRFDVGEPQDYITLPMAEAGLKQILDWGTPRIIETLKPLMGKLADGAEALGLKPPPKEERAPHILGLAFPEAPARDLPSRLAQQGVYVSLRGNTLRVSPHLYNDERDVERFLNALDRLLQRSAA